MVNCMRMPDQVRLITETNTTIMTKNGEGFEHRDARLSFKFIQNELSLIFSANDSEVRFIVLRWSGSMDSKRRYLSDAFERGYGNLEWRCLNQERIMPWYFIASDGVKNNGYGVKVRPDAFCFFMCDAGGITLWLDVRSGADGVVLGGRELQAAVIVEAESEGENPFQFTKRFCKLMCNDALLPSYPVYGSNNWYYAYGKSSENEIIADTELLAGLTKGIENRPYMVIDDCWQEMADIHHAAGRPYKTGNCKFPDMAGLADEMKKMNVKPGLWFRPLRTHENNIPASLLHPVHSDILDPSLPEVLEMVAEDTERFVNWGYQLIKYDFVTKDLLGEYYSKYLPLLKMRGWHFHDRSLTTARCIKNLYKTLKESSKDAVLIGCNAIGHLASGYIHLHRSGDDTSGRSYDRSIMMGVNTLAFRLPQHNAFFKIDADCVGITENIPWGDNRMLLELFSHSGTPLFISAAPGNITDNMKTDLHSAFELASKQECDMEPVDWMDTILPEDYIVDGQKYHWNWIKECGLAGFTSRV